MSTLPENALEVALNVALEAADAARAVILEHYGDPSLKVDTKPDRTPVSEADRAAETAIREVLRRHFPEHGIFGEEQGRADGDGRHLWLVDPIDGTKSYVRGYGMFSCQIALWQDGQVVLGVSDAPAHRERAWAVRGQGAWLDGERVRVSDVSALADATISTGNLRSLAQGDGWDRLGRVFTECGRTRGYGDYYHYHRLAAGQLDAVVESDVNILDIAALSVIVEEAGGVFTDLQGRALTLDTTSVLAATPALHATLLGRLQATA